MSTRGLLLPPLLGFVWTKPSKRPAGLMIQSCTVFGSRAENQLIRRPTGAFKSTPNSWIANPQISPVRICAARVVVKS